MPDDHEFWNDYPDASPFIGNSQSATGRRRWTEAALWAYLGFQYPYDAPTAPPADLDELLAMVDRPVVADVPPLSIFAADVRSRRQPADVDGRRAMTPAALDDLRVWVDRLNGGGPGRAAPATGDSTRVLLVGGATAVDVRLRVAQAHARHDLTPSLWAHAVLLGPPAAAKSRPGDAATYDVPLETAAGFAHPTRTNGVQRGRLRAYASPDRYPNVAVVHVPVAWADVRGPLERFQTQRAVLDAVELLLLWFGFTWGVGRAGNPLLDGQGMRSAAMIEYVFAAAGFELTPGLASRASCPEAIWQSAKWWHGYYGRTNATTADGTDGRRLTGAYVAPHRLCEDNNKD